jgi:RNA polymerase sigma factor (sigma-70 family)
MTENFAIVLEKLRPRLVYLFQRRGLGDQAEDFAQETIIRVLLKHEEIQEGHVFQEPYVFAVATNVLHEWWRHRRRTVQIDPDLPEPADPGPLVEEQLIGDQEKGRDRQLLSTCRKNLKPEQRQLLELYEDETRSKEVLAAALDITPNALRVRIHCVREKIRECMNKSRRTQLLQIAPIPKPRRAI